MDDLTMLREAWGEPGPPAPAARAAARAALLERSAPRSEAPRQGRDTPGRRGLPRSAWVAASSLAAAAAVIVAVQSVGGPDTGNGFPGAGSGITVAELAYRTSTVAAAGPSVRPGQWVYRVEKQAPTQPPGPFRVWSTADSGRAALFLNGHLRTFRSDCGKVGPSQCRFNGQPGLLNSSRHRSVMYVEIGPMTVSYAGLSSLPHDPRALLRYLGRLHVPGEGPAPVREFQAIEQMLTSYVMPPALTAELYRSLADIPGVTVNHHAVDVAGRTGVGFQLVLPKAVGSLTDELIINPHTYQLMGQVTLTAQATGKVLYGIAILRQALVSGPGVLP